MWLLFYVIDSLSVKFLQEGKQAIQRQPFLHNANLPTSMPTDNHPSVSHREFEINYAKCHHTDDITDGLLSVGISQRVRKELQQNATVTNGYTEGIKSVGISQRVRKHLQQNATISDGCTDGIGPSVICRSHILPTELPTDVEKYGGLLKIWCEIQKLLTDF